MLASRQTRRDNLAEPVDGQTDQNINEHCRGAPLGITVALADPH